ncbi:azurin [Alteromonas sp. 5E99-2]|uniref:azurin n=1 Tax=Alteromonas sp. 5E99-2 TaxID=2817683 RepID=UPI001A99F148|nr:azurin [Alteromonas sp. 5E99-2]MBO1254709.1 azurin [Alteromonas sp. 5E99-2]
MRKITALFLVLVGLSTAYADECAIDVTVGDVMAFTPSSINVSKSACSTLTIKLTHSGKIPKAAMGHNWVLSKTADAQNVAQTGWSEGLENNYLQKGDQRIIANTSVVGGGESASVEFNTAELEAGGDYTFFCSFVGHYFSMNGKFNVSA